MFNLSLSPSRFRDIKKLSVNEKNLKASEMLGSNDLIMARFYLLDELSLSELKQATPDVLFNQILLGRFLTFTGASHSALRIAHKVMIILKREKRINFFSSHLYYQLAAVFLETAESHQILELAKIYKKNSFSKNLNFELILLQYKIFSGKSHFNKKNYQKYDMWIKTLQKTSPQLSEYIQYLQLYNLFYDRQVSCRDILSRITYFESLQIYNVAVSYSHLKAKCYLFEKNDELALKALNQYNTRHFYFRIESFFLKKYYLHQCLSLENDISLHCYPSFNSYSHISGNRFFPAKYKIAKSFINHLPYLEKKIFQKKEKFWLIEDNTLQSYKISKKFYEKEQYIDLVSGIIKTQGKIVSLGKARSAALVAIISTGGEGANEYLMSDVIYPGENVSHQYLFSRVQDLVTQLQKLGLPVFRQERKIFFNFKKNKHSVLISKNYKYFDELFYLANHFKTINRTILKNELNISTRTANLYLKKWAEEKRIKPDFKKYGNFKIISKTAFK